MGDKRITFALSATMADTNTWRPKGINRIDAVFVTSAGTANAGNAIEVAVSGSTATFSVVGTAAAVFLLAIGN
jgi:hypothetical protein